MEKLWHYYKYLGCKAILFSLKMCCTSHFQKSDASFIFCFSEQRGFGINLIQSSVFQALVVSTDSVCRAAVNLPPQLSLILTHSHQSFRDNFVVWVPKGDMLRTRKHALNSDALLFQHTAVFREDSEGSASSGTVFVLLWSLVVLPWRTTDVGKNQSRKDLKLVKKKFFFSDKGRY